MTAIGLRRNSARLYGFIRNVPLRLVTWVVRNRLTRDHIMASLPSDAATVAWEVTRNTRLRRGEKAAVAAELIDHFREGLAAETAVADLVARFGDPKRAAKLIRRAKLRCRAWPDRLCRRITRAVGIGLIAAVALYGVLTIRYITAEPVVRESLVERTNRAAMAIPESDRAWPLYRQVLTLLGDLPLHPAPSLDDVLADMKANSALSIWGWESRLPHADEPLWDEAQSYLDQHTRTWAILEEATLKPALGFSYSAEDSPIVPQPPASNSMGWVDQAIHRWTRFGAFGDTLAAFIALHARSAAYSGDRDGFVRDIRMMQRMASHLGSPSATHGRWLYQTSMDMVAQVLWQHPMLLTDEQLTELGHTLASFEPIVDLSGAVASFNDLVQQMYTDNGQGDGRLTPHGVRMSLMGREPTTAERLLGPIAAAVVLSRRDVLSEYQNYISMIEAESRKPLWEMHESEAERYIRDNSRSAVSSLRLAPIWMTVEARRVGPIKELAVGHRDAVITAIALELHRRRHGHWPAGLDELTPAFVPKIPLDRFDGRPLRYKVTDGKPLLYSVGPDGDDDGGRSRDGHPGGGEWMSGWVGPANERHAEWYSDGDWILWPVPRGGE